MKAATAEMEVLGIGLTEQETSLTNLQDTTGTLSEAFALLHSAGMKLDRLLGVSTSPSLRSYERRNSASGMRSLRRHVK